MKLRKLKLLAMALSLFAACGGMLSAMETQKSEENSKVNSKSGQNKNKTQNNKPQSDGKSNKNSGLQIPHYVYPVGYLGLNEIGNLLGFDYLPLGRYGIIKGAKHLLFGESNKKVEDKANEVNYEIRHEVNYEIKSEVNNKIKNKVNYEIKNEVNYEIKSEVEKGPYWQYNYDVIKKTIKACQMNRVQFEKTLERIMSWPNEKILSGQPKVSIGGCKNLETGFSHEEFLKDLRGNREIGLCKCNSSNEFYVSFKGDNKVYGFRFFGGYWGNNNKMSITLFRGEFVSFVNLDFSVPIELYS